MAQDSGSPKCMEREVSMDSTVPDFDHGSIPFPFATPQTPRGWWHWTAAGHRRWQIALRDAEGGSGIDS